MAHYLLSRGMAASIPLAQLRLNAAAVAAATTPLASAAAAAPPSFAEAPTAPTIYQYPEGCLELVPRGEVTRVRLNPQSSSSAIRGCTEVDTPLPAPLIHRIAAVHGFAETCNVIARHQDPRGLQHSLGRQLSSYLPDRSFSGKFILDFGCGSGASTNALARLLPDSHVIGVDFDAERIALAEAMSQTPNLSFRLSPGSGSLPAGLPPFDSIFMSAAYHHMLPAERKGLLPLLWKLLTPGGALLFSGTPHRWLPWEPDLTGLPLLNYLPDRAAALLGQHPPSRYRPSAAAAAAGDSHWRKLLRAGIRGASEREILNLLPASAQVLQPTLTQSRADHWRESAGPGPSPMLWVAKRLFRWTERRWGVVPSPYLDLVIRKLG